jgi:hypothetical protein
MNGVRSVAVAAVAVSAVAGAGPAAAEPDEGWTNARLLDCGGEIVRTNLTPAGFGTPFHVVGSTDVIVPMHTETVVDGRLIVAIDVPGFDPTRDDAVTCTYTDPAGLFVTVSGIRS